MMNRRILLVAVMAALPVTHVAAGATTPAAALSKSSTVSITTRCISLNELLAKLSTQALKLSCAPAIAHQKLQIHLIHQPIGQVLKDLAQLLDGAWIQGNAPHSLYFYMRKSAVQSEDTWWQLFWRAFRAEEAKRPARLLSVLNSTAPINARFSINGPSQDSARIRSGLWLMKHGPTLFRDLPPTVKFDLVNATLSPNDFALLPSGIGRESTVDVVPLSQLPTIFLKAVVQSESFLTNRRATAAQIPSGTVLAVSVQNRMPSLRAFRAVGDLPGIGITLAHPSGSYITSPPFPLSARALKERIRARREENRHVPQMWQDLAMLNASTVWPLHALTASDLTSSIAQIAADNAGTQPGLGGLHATTVVPNLQPLPFATPPAAVHGSTFSSMQFTSPPQGAAGADGGTMAPKIPHTATPVSRADAITYLASKGGMQFLADYYSTPCRPLSHEQVSTPLHGSLSQNLDVLSVATGGSWTKAHDGIILFRDNHWYRDDRLEVPNSTLHKWLGDFQKLQNRGTETVTSHALRDQWDLRYSIETSLTSLQLENGLIWWMTKSHKTTYQPFAWIGAQIGDREGQLGFWHSLSRQQRRLLAHQNLPFSDLTTQQNAAAMRFYPQIACLAAPERVPKFGIMPSGAIMVDSTAPYLEFPFVEIKAVPA